MHVLIIGSGGREHALGWAIYKSHHKPRITTIPGNAGTSRVGHNVDLDIDNFDGIAEYAFKNEVDLVVVGPEAPLVAGLADALIVKGIKVFGPVAEAAVVEGSKVFTKEFCARHGIPSADYVLFDDAEAAHKFVNDRAEETCVVKVDGLAAGKGAIVCDDKIDAHSAVDTCLVEKKFGDAGNRIIIEDRLTGFETTLLTLVAGNEYRKFLYSQDHKRAYDGDRGPNTGGMGVFAPTPKISDEMDARITKEILEPTLNGLIEEGINYTGCLYFGLMITDGGPNLIEYNCRFGDPEAQAVLPLMDGDFLDALIACTEKKLGEIELKPSGKKSLTVILASEGYPDEYEKGLDITEQVLELEETNDLLVFHAGTRQGAGKISTSGGRVLAVTAVDTDFEKCRKKLYYKINGINFVGLFYRQDIGHELVSV
ncbi:MAG TPA: phosphoribosylamine--glycine ligase [bacterium]|jgi:phosphoribosylamine--glycine ligase